MSDNPNGPTIVVPVNAAEPEEPSPGLVELLHPHRLVVLGYYPVPDQASPEQLREEYETEATAAVEEIAGHFAAQGGTVDSLVVFTRDYKQTIDRVASEQGANAVLTPGESGERLDRVLVPLRGDANLERIVGFVGDLLRESDAEVTVYNVAASDDEASTGEFLLRGACDRLEDEGVDPNRVNWQQDRGESTADAIVAAAAEYDLLVVGESEPSLRDRILGNVTGLVIEETTHPVLVVRDV